MSLEIQSYSAVALVRPCTPDERLSELDDIYNKDVLLTLAGSHVPASNEESDDMVYLAPCSDFPGPADGMVAGYYRVVGRPKAECPDLQFRAAYYTMWRDHVAYAVSGRRLDDLRSSDVEPHPLFALLLFSDQEGLIGPETSARIRGGFEAARPLLVDHAAHVDELRKSPTAVDALIDRLWPAPDELTFRRLMAELPGSRDQQKALARRYFTRQREHGRYTLEDPGWPGAWLASCAEVEAVFAAAGPSGCIAFG
jgi:hypothetical protein